jgi:hypothetical protein
MTQWRPPWDTAQSENSDAAGFFRPQKLPKRYIFGGDMVQQTVTQLLHKLEAEGVFAARVAFISASIRKRR